MRPKVAGRVLYALGGFGAALLQQTVLLWVFFFYAPPPGQPHPMRVTPATAGLAMAAGRIVDALADPLVAHWSDSLRSRLGRRRPFVLGASPLLALCFVLLWRPPDAGISAANAVYLTATLGAFFFLYTMVLNPYIALLPEVTARGRGRVATTSLQAGFNLAGIGAAFVGSSWLSTRFGFPTMGIALAPLGLAALLVSTLGVRERVPTQPPQPLGAILRGILGDRRFRIFIPAIATVWFGLSMVQLTLALVVTVLMELPQAAVAPLLGLVLGVTALSLPLTARLIRRLGERRTILAAMALLAADLPLAAAIGRWPLPLAPAAEGIIVLALSGPAVGAMFILPNALLAEIAEDHGRLVGTRAEGMFFAFQGVIFNGTTSLSAAALGALIQWLGQSPPDAWGLRAALLVAALSTAAGALIFTRYPQRPNPPLRKAERRAW